MAQKLTKRIIDAARAGQTLWDGELPGFGVRKSASGVASYVLKYRANGRQRWLTIGRHGAPWTPETARKKALEALVAVANGEDPASAKAEARGGLTLREFAARYQADYSAHHKKPSSREADTYHLKNHILPRLGSSRLNAITKQDVAKLHTALADRPYTANRVLALLSHLYTIAARWGEVPEGVNPAASVLKFKEQARDRYLSPDELMRLGRALEEHDPVNPYAVAALRLALFTGARIGEVLGLRWEHVDLENHVLRLPDSKTGKKVITLTAPAAEILASMPRRESNPHVICGEKAGAPLVNIQKPWRRIRKSAGLDDVRIHDLRHSFASVAAAGGLGLPMIGALLGHTQPRTTQRYTHLADDPRRAAADVVASKIASALSGQKADVVPIKRNS